LSRTNNPLKSFNGGLNKKIINRSTTLLSFIKILKEILIEYILNFSAANVSSTSNTRPTQSNLITLSLFPNELQDRINRNIILSGGYKMACNVYKNVKIEINERAFVNDIEISQSFLVINL